MPKFCRKAEKRLHLDAEKFRPLAEPSKCIWRMRPTKGQATSLVKSVDKVENQGPVQICVLLISSQLNVLELYPQITSSHLDARRASCGLTAFPHTKLHISESLMGQLLRSSRLSPPLLARNAMLIQGHVMLKSLYERYNVQSLRWDQPAVLRLESLSCVLSEQVSMQTAMK